MDVEALKAQLRAKNLMTRSDEVGTAGVSQASIELITAYRNVFLHHPDGPLVLGDLLGMLRFTEKGADLVHLAMHNVALEILSRCGVDIMRSILGGEK